MNKIRWRERASAQPVLSGTRRPRLTNRRARSTHRLQHERVRSSPDLLPEPPIQYKRKTMDFCTVFWEIDATVTCHRDVSCPDLSLQYRNRKIDSTVISHHRPGDSDLTCLTQKLACVDFDTDFDIAFDAEIKLYSKFFVCNFIFMERPPATKTAINFLLDYSKAISAWFMCRRDA